MWVGVAGAAGSDARRGFRLRRSLCDRQPRTLQTRAIHFLKPDVAVVDGTFEITGMKGPDGKALPTRSGLTTIVAMKKGDLWYIAALRGMVPSTLPSATSK